MAAETITVDGKQFVLLPHQANWSTEPKTVEFWGTKISSSPTGSEDRARTLAYPFYRLTWLVTSSNESEDSRLEARVLAAQKTGYAAAPWFGMAMVVSSANSGSSTVTVESSPWLPVSGDWIILIGDVRGSQPVYEAREVQSVLGNVISIAGTLTYTWQYGSICRPVIAGEFECKSRPSLSGVIGDWSFTIETEIKPPPGGAVQIDGYQSVLGSLENYTDKWGPFVQMDGYQSVLASFKTDTEIPPWGNHVQVDGYQAVVLVLES